ncbi:sigma factor-like helix-turn-helix DNA-binding protein [Sphingosinicella sp.]|uniref:sigma factor-like helix-turn-helix DNA-binding protein n=1 Tax=Sphingosinicella sp. TaxID=1917971 RepID=UPI0035B0D315
MDQDRYRSAVRALPAPLRDILARALDDWPYDAIAEHLGIGVTEVEAGLAEAIARLVAALDSS